METIYDFSNSANWNLIWSTEQTAQPVPADALRQYYPIADFTAPIQITSPIVAIYPISDTDPGTWKRAGVIKQKISTGITGGGSPDSFISEKRLRLKEINICQFERVTTSYAIEFSIYYWLRHINLTVWEYTGLISNTIQQQLDDIELKLDQLL